MLNKKVESIIQKTKMYSMTLILTLTNFSYSFAEDEITRKVNKGKIFVIGIMTTLAVINFVMACQRVGGAKYEQDLQKAERQRTNAGIALATILAADTLIALWKSW